MAIVHTLVHVSILICFFASVLQLRDLFANSSMISTELKILSERLYAQVNIDSNDEGQLQKKRQTTPTRYLLLAPVVYTVNILNRTMSIENVTEEIRSVNDSAERSEIIGYNAVGMCVKILFV